MAVELLPFDEHNQRLVELVRPPAWLNPDPTGRYNVVVIGGGTAGLVAAGIAAGLGAKTALAERHLLGGDCLNYGCVPSKALMAAARVAHAARHAERFGVRVGAVDVDFGAVMSRVRQVRAQIAPHDSAERLMKMGVDVYLGEARFLASDVVEVEGKRLRFARAIIATGGRPAAPPIDGLEAAGYLTNETIFSLTERPARLLVIGGGPIGCEMAQAFARLGSRVTLLNKASRLLPRDDPKASRLLEVRFESEGIRVVNGVKVQRAERLADERSIEYSLAGSRERVIGDTILVATGRTPNLEALGLDAAGVAHDASGLVVDEHLRTTNRRIFAAGDVCAAYKFTHAADAMARIAIQNALFLPHKRPNALTIPWCTYTEPEVAHVGESAEYCEGAGLKYVEVELSRNDRAMTDGLTQGFARAYYSGRTGKIVGATLVADHAGDLIGELVLAMNSGSGLGQLSATIHPYPTQSEVIKHLGDAFLRTKATPSVLSLLRRFFRWRR